MSDIKLKPCPFCGSECVNDTTPPTGGEDGVFSWYCPCCVSSGAIGRTLLGATDGWNSRANNDTLVAQNLALKAALETLIGRAEKCDSWESFPCGYLDDAYKALEGVGDE